MLALELDGLDHPDAPRLRAEVIAMRRLIDQLMLLARVEAQSVAQSIRDSVRLEDVSADVVSLMAPGAIAAEKSLSLTRVGDVAPIMGQRETVAAALRNLVENALRVTPAGGAVTVIAGPGPRLRVKDGGAGLTPERLAELVQRHRRADHASSEGAGLGLAIVARIMAAHGGTLSSVADAQELVLNEEPISRPHTDQLNGFSALAPSSGSRQFDPIGQDHGPAIPIRAPARCSRPPVACRLFGGAGRARQ